MNLKTIRIIRYVTSCIVILFSFQCMAQDVLVENLDFSNKEIKYSGVFSKPSGDGPFPVVILLSGMGLQTRDWSFAGGKYKMAKVIADFLNKEGIAVYRFDDRGYGESTGSAESEVPFDVLSADIFEAVKLLKSRSDVQSVGLLGHSLGGILAIMTAGEHTEVDFIITLSGSYQNGAEIKMEQASTLKRWRTSAEMTDEEVVRKGEEFAEASLSFSNGGEGLETMKEILKELVTFQIMTLPADNMAENLTVYKDTTEFIQKSYEGAVDYYTSAHQKSFIAYDPAEGLKKVNCPILILFGEKDNHVTVKSNMPKIGKTLLTNSFSDLTIKIIPEADHGYSGPQYFDKGEMVPQVLEFISNWINFRKYYSK